MYTLIPFHIVYRYMYGIGRFPLFLSAGAAMLCCAIMYHIVSLWRHSEELLHSLICRVPKLFESYQQRFFVVPFCFACLGLLSFF